MDMVKYLVLPEEKLAFEIGREVDKDKIDKYDKSLTQLFDSLDFEEIMDRPVKDLSTRDFIQILEVYLKVTEIPYYSFGDLSFCNWFKEHNYQIVDEYSFNDKPEYQTYRVITQFPSNKINELAVRDDK